MASHGIMSGVTYEEDMRERKRVRPPPLPAVST
jgi:hypothetical protein